MCYIYMRLLQIKSLEFLDLLLYPYKFHRKQVFTPGPGNSAKFVWHALEIPGSKNKEIYKPMEIPHDFLLNIPGYCNSFLIDPWEALI